MSQIITQSKASFTGFGGLWGRVPVLIRALIMGFFSTTIGVFGVQIIASFFPGVWQLVAYGVLLWLYWKFFSGSSDQHCT
ncbi:MAG: hypothetical protein FVQ83_16855 [Chloroflexi bacterium]|nr:hypothetical protein [Chloroflexota bacterium]